MPPRPWAQRIEDMVDAIFKIQRAINGKSYRSFVAEEVVVAAVCYFIVVIGEAAVAVPEEVQVRAPTIPWNELRGIRNRRVHQYFQVSLPIVWDAATVDLPPLVADLHRLLTEVEGA